MHAKMLASIAALTVATILFSTQLAYAQEDDEFITMLLESSASDAAAGAAAGFIMSLVAVLGKRIKNKSIAEPVNLKLLLITVAIAGAIGWMAPMLGLTTDATIPAVIGLTYIVNQTLRPIFAKWITK